MFKKDRMNQPQFPGGMPFSGGQPFGPQMQSQFGGPQMQPSYGGMQAPSQGSGMYPGMQTERLQYEIMENRRRINNLAKRIARIESYLRIRDTSEYGYVEEDKPSNFSF